MMKHRMLAGGLLLFASLVSFGTTASAHEHGVFEIGGQYYQFTIGSQGEPVVVDDRSGLDLRVQKLSSPTASSGTPVLGLESSLKLEISASGQKRTQDITGVWGQPGAYTSLFYPTQATVLSYRIFGTIENADVDLTFTCHPGGHVMGGAPDMTPKDMGKGVTRYHSSGSFGCPMEKAELGFPARSASVGSMSETLRTHGVILETVNREFHFVEIALGLLAVGFGLILLKKRP